MPIITPPHWFFFFSGGGDIFCGVSQYCAALDLGTSLAADRWPKHGKLFACTTVGPQSKVVTSEGSEGLKVCFGGMSMEFQECDDMIISIWLHDVYVNVYFFAGIFSQSSSVDCISISKESSIMRFMMSHDFFNQIHERRFHSWQAHRNNISWQNRALKTVSPRGLFFLDDCWCSHVIHHNIHNEDVTESIWMIV